MEEMSKTGHIGQAAMKADMDRKTARRYVKAQKLPSELKTPRWWRTRQDRFAEDWPEIEKLLGDAPGMEAQTVLEVLQERHPGRYDEAQLRTLQRRIRRWRAESGPDREIMFGQAHRPGEAGQTDFTWGTELAVTIAGVAFVHMLCVFVLPYSNWQWATVCLSESLAALRRGIQAALFQLGRVPSFHQTDNSTAATHKLGRQEAERDRRGFNEEYLGVMRHFGMEPRTIEVGEKEQNGDVEAGHRALKRRLEQALLKRGSRDFRDRDDYESWVQEILVKTNSGRGPRVAEEIAAMRPLAAAKLPEFTELEVPVCTGSTARVKRCVYSLPSRLIGERLLVRLFDERVEFYYAGHHQMTVERLRGDKRHCIDYRHVIWSLVRKPGAFARYVYREEMFPSLIFRRAYDAIQTPNRGTKGDLEYLRILHLAASTIEADVERALTLLLVDAAAITADAVKRLIGTQTEATSVPALARPEVDLGVYDALLVEAAS